MKTKNTKKITALDVVMVVYTIAILAMIGVTLYGWFFSGRHETIIHPSILACNSAAYCCLAASLEEQKKKAKKAEENNEKA